MSALRLELINTGTELLLGQTLNTHAHWLGGQLFDIGIRIQRQICIPDGEEIRAALVDAMPRCDAILVTGGLGPTSDDMTREIAAGLFGVTLVEDPAVVGAIQAYLARRKRELNAQTRRQAMVPVGARVLSNPNGTAPGLYFPPMSLPGRNRPTPHIFLLPGPPRELKPMYRDHVAPVLAGLLTEKPPGLRNFRLAGLGESQASLALEERLLATGIQELGYCVKPGEVIVRCIGSETQLDACGAIVRESFPAEFFTDAEQAMEEVVVALLRERREWLATAESCTGGLLANRITNVPGASAVFGWGFVTYANEAKSGQVGVPAELIAAHGAVSEPVARAMAEGALKTAGADHALAITGIAGPDGGSAEKPVGTVFIALASKRAATVAIRELFPFDRDMFKIMTTQTALDLLRRRLIGRAGPESR